MNKKKNPVVFLDVSIDGSAAEKIVIEVIYELNIINLYGCLPFLGCFSLFFRMKQCLETVSDMSYIPITATFFFWVEMCSSLQILSQRLQKISGHSAQVYCWKLYLLCAIKRYLVKRK